ncbi:hypothetical protein XENTR_v10001802 [Xenopus tropicalis]|nr:hypothetical protein XENTR_v10001802 [Xenopus tropicalis]
MASAPTLIITHMNQSTTVIKQRNKIGLLCYQHLFALYKANSFCILIGLLLICFAIITTACDISMVLGYAKRPCK